MKAIRQLMNGVLFLFALSCAALVLRADEPAAPKLNNDAAKPAPPPSAITLQKTGELSLRFVNADVRTVVQVLADGADLNLVMADDLKGTVTIQLRDVTYEQAMRLVLEAKGFAMVREGNIVKVKSLVVTRTSTEPLEMAVISLQYARADDVVRALTPLLSPLGKVTQLAAPPIAAGPGGGAAAAGAAGGAAGGARGEPRAPRTNTIVIAEVAALMPRLKTIVEALDTQPRQIMIQSKLWDITKNPTEVKGIDWSKTFSSYDLGLSAGQSPALIPGAHSDTAANRTLPTTFLLHYPNLYSTALLNAQQLQATLGFLYTDTDSELIGAPHVAVEDGKTADLTVSTQVPIPEFSFDSTTATLQLTGFTFKDIGITLNVTPRVNADSFVHLVVKPEVSNINADPALAKFGTISGNTTVNLPIINTRSATSEIMIKSGNTLAIGGLMSDDNTKSYTKVPVLGDVPLLGYAFRHRNLTRTKRNLLIFITPTILDPNGGTGLESEAKDFPTGHQEAFADDKEKQNAKPKQWQQNYHPAEKPAVRKANEPYYNR